MCIYVIFDADTFIQVIALPYQISYQDFSRNF